MFFHGAEEAVFPGDSTGGAFHVAEHDDFAFAVEERGEEFAGFDAALEVIGGDEGGVLVGFEVGVDDHRGDSGADGIMDGRAEGAIVEGGEDESIDVADDHVFDDFDLGVAVIFLEAAFPDDVDVAEFLGGFECAGVDGFPEDVGGAFGDDADHEVFIGGCGVGGGVAGSWGVLLSARDGGEAQGQC